MPKNAISTLAQVVIFLAALGMAIWLFSVDYKVVIGLFFGLLFFIAILLGLYSDFTTPEYISETAPTIPPPQPPAPPTSSVEDAGLIAYWGEQSAYLYRTQAIPNTAHALQPYVQLHITQAATYQLQFEILDAQETLVFTHSVEPLLVQVTNLILPPARLPLSTLSPDTGAWTLRVHVDGVLTTTHRFTWRSDNIDSLAGNIDSDGEIDESILPLLADNYAQPMSLEDLLANRGDDALGIKTQNAK